MSILGLKLFNYVYSVLYQPLNLALKGVFPSQKASHIVTLLQITGISLLFRTLHLIDD